MEDVDGLKGEGEADVEGELEARGMWNSSKQFRVLLWQKGNLTNFAHPPRPVHLLVS